MINAKDSQLNSMLDGLATSFLIEFDRDIHDIWFGPFKIEHRRDDRLISKSLRWLELQFQKLISDGVTGSLAISRTPHTYVLLYRRLSDLFADSECILSERSAEATQLDSVVIFAPADLAELRRQMEHQLDTYKAMFNDIESDGAMNSQTKNSKIGRKPKYDWFDAACKVWGKIHRGDLPVKQQKDIEAELVTLLSNGNDIPNSETVRPYARIIMREFEYDPQDEK